MDREALKVSLLSAVEQLIAVTERISFGVVGSRPEEPLGATRVRIRPEQPRDILGFDLSATTDLTALVLTCRKDGLVYVWSYFWMPQDSVQEAARRDRAPYDVWVKQGLLRTTPGKVIDYDFVARDIGELTAGLNIALIGFDRWRMDRMKASLERQGVDLPLKEHGQGFKDMSPALDALEADLLKGIVRHGGHPVLTMCAANAVAVPDPAGNRKLDKSKATGRIDGMVALTMAEGVEAMAQELTPVSPWDDPSFSLAAA